MTSLSNFAGSHLLFNTYRDMFVYTALSNLTAAGFNQEKIQKVENLFSHANMVAFAVSHETLYAIGYHGHKVILRMKQNYMESNAHYNVPLSVEDKWHSIAVLKDVSAGNRDEVY